MTEIAKLCKKANIWQRYAKIAKTPEEAGRLRRQALEWLHQAATLKAKQENTSMQTELTILRMLAPPQAR